MPAPDEDQVAELCRQGAFGEATMWVLRSFGAEIMTYLLALERSSADAEDTFAEFSDALFRGLPTFRWECSLRTFAYTLAHRQWARAVRTRVRRREVPISAEAEELAARMRTVTAEYLRTDARARWEKLRASLSDEDRTLLILRLDRRLAWIEVARIMTDEGCDQALTRAAAALRKRYERLKDTLRKELRGAGPSD